MKVQSYLIFDGRCEEAIEFYKKALGAEVLMLMRFKDSPEPCSDGSAPPPEKVMHASLKIGQTVIMASDGRCTGSPHFAGFSQAITVTEADEAARLFAALSDGGQVQMPLTKTFFSPQFGMVADRFGINWMVLVGE